MSIHRHQGRTQDFRRGGGGVAEIRQRNYNKPNKRATELKPRTCAHQGSMFRPYTSVCFVESSIFIRLLFRPRPAGVSLGGGGGKAPFGPPGYAPGRVHIYLDRPTYIHVGLYTYIHIHTYIYIGPTYIHTHVYIGLHIAYIHVYAYT